MRTQQLVARALLLVATLMVGQAQAQGPAGPPAGKGKHSDDKRDHGKGAPGKGDDAAANAPGKDKDKDDGKPDDDNDKGHEARHGMGHHGMHELIEELKSGKLKSADVKARLGKLREQRDERMKEHREQLKARFGATLALPSAHDELDHHARRMAKLDRAMLLCETETVKDKDKLKDRIQKLIDKENARHEKAMDHLKSMPSTPAASAGAAASAAPAVAPTPAASAAVKAGDK